MALATFSQPICAALETKLDNLQAVSDLCNKLIYSLFYNLLNHVTLYALSSDDFSASTDNLIFTGVLEPKINQNLSHHNFAGVFTNQEK